MAEGAPVRMRRRCLIAVLLVIIVGFGGVSVQLGKLQLVKGEELQQQAINQQMRDTTINATRGTIYAVSYTHLDVYKRQEEELAAVPGMNRPAAAAVYRYFHAQHDDREESEQNG